MSSASPSRFFGLLAGDVSGTLLLLLLFLPGDSSLADTVTPESETHENLGIDVSHHQGEIDWHKVHEHGVDFVYIKATEGLAYVDPTFVKNREALGTYPIHVGAYHYFHAGDDPVDQAHHFLKVINEGPALNLPPAVDVEQLYDHTPEDVIAALIQWAEVVEDALGITPYIYTVTGFMKRHIENPELTRFPLWFAKYDATRFELPEYLDRFHWRIWQYRQGEIPGIKGKVDFNYFRCDDAYPQLC